MPLPDYQSLMRPTLEVVADGHVHSASEINARLAEMLQLSESDLAELLPSGPQTLFANRAGWARSYLYKAKLLERPRRAHYQITDRGREALASDADRITAKYLKQFLDDDGGGNGHANGGTGKVGPGPEPSTPHELVAKNYCIIKEELATEILERVKQCSPQFFERLVVNLLVTMGYGGSIAEAGKAVGRSGDDGIDGIIKEDRLGLDAVYIQAKRWKECVGRPTVQAFAGSLEGQRARKGVLITTSRFSDEAKEYVGRISKSIVLIDGMALAQLMIDFDVGVTEVARYPVKRLDADYFEDAEGAS